MSGLLNPVLATDPDMSIHYDEMTISCADMSTSPIRHIIIMRVRSNLGKLEIKVLPALSSFHRDKINKTKIQNVKSQSSVSRVQSDKSKEIKNTSIEIHVTY